MEGNEEAESPRSRRAQRLRKKIVHPIERNVDKQGTPEKAVVSDDGEGESSPLLTEQLGGPPPLGPLTPQGASSTPAAPSSSSSSFPSSSSLPSRETAMSDLITLLGATPPAPTVVLPLLQKCRNLARLKREPHLTDDAKRVLDELNGNDEASDQMV